LIEFVVLIAIAIAFFFAFWNGFTDAANAIATIIGTRVLTPVRAVILSAFGNFVGMFFGVAVATTIGKGIINSEIVTAELVIAALVGGLIWDGITWYFGIPCSETHVLVGGLVGAGIAIGGIGVVKLNGIVDKVLIPMITSPIIAFLFAFLFATLIIRLFKKHSPSRLNKYFGKLQLLSSFFFSVTHGSNDAQKTMGIITVLMVAYAMIPTFKVPLWVMLTSFIFISLGTLFGGWRIVKTMSFKITKLQPYQGFAAEASGAIVLAATAQVGFPVSTTHAISGSIMGVGATTRLSAVRWGVARKIVWAWVLTMPMSAIFSYLTYRIIGILM
jgi:PiT family inorganic phosphate transporter